MMRRYDVYGFRDPSLENAAAFVGGVLGIDLRLRDSSYSGLYYCAGSGVAKDFVIEVNDEKSRWHSQYSQYGAILMVNNIPDMDVIRDKLTAGRTDPVFLRSIIHTKEPPEEYPPDEES